MHKALVPYTHTSMGYGATTQIAVDDIINTDTIPKDFRVTFETVIGPSGAILDGKRLHV